MRQDLSLVSVTIVGPVLTGLTGGSDDGSSEDAHERLRGEQSPLLLFRFMTFGNPGRPGDVSRDFSSRALREDLFRREFWRQARSENMASFSSRATMSRVDESWPSMSAGTSVVLECLGDARRRG